MPKAKKDPKDLKLPGTLKFSLRLMSNSVTSVSINTKLILLWITISTTDSFTPNLKNPKVSITNLCYNFMNRKLKDYDKGLDKGLSEFLTDCFIVDIIKKIGNRIYSEIDADGDEYEGEILSLIEKFYSMQEKITRD